MAAKVLRTDQEQALENMRIAFRQGHRQIVMQAPTGYGKTLLSAGLTDSALRKNKRVLFTVPNISLIDQTLEMFNKQGISEVGVMQADHALTDWSQPVQIASVQTLMRREKCPQADIVLLDEIHKWFKYFEKMLGTEDCPGEWAKVPVIGLSATPWTKGLGAYFSTMITASTTRRLIEQGLLSPFRVFAPSHPDLSGIRVVAGDYVENELSVRMRGVELVGDVIDTWLQHACGRPTLVFGVDCAHAQMLQQRFLEAGVRAGYQDAQTPVSERAIIKRQFHNGELDVVCNVGTLTTGVDWDVRCISCVRPTKSDMLFVQIVGRGLRTADGKQDLLLLDHSDNSIRLGFVTDIDEAHAEQGLHDGKTPVSTDAAAGEHIRLPKECAACGALKPPGTAVCPNCGTRVEAHCTITHRDGELRELTGEKKRIKDAEHFTMDEKRIFLSELKGYARAKGRKEGWAAYAYREKFKVWPDHSIRHVAPRMEISNSTYSWITSRNIAYAKSKRRNGVNGHVNGHSEPVIKPQFVPGTLCTPDDLEVDL